MATFTVTASQNIDALTSKGGGDTYNINGGTLTIDQDSRYGLNATTSASIGTMTLSATLGGTVEIDARFVRLIPYNTGVGTVPASGITVTQGGASGTLIGVYSALNAAPTAAGGAMPASGWIKVKAWNSVAYAAGALVGTGLVATATGPDVVGWIELVGDEAGTLTVNRLNSFRVRGEWYDLGTTDGNRATTYQIPSNGQLQYHGGVWVETGTGTGVYEMYPCAGTLAATAANLATDAVRGKVCWISTGGLLRFGHDGTNSTGGFIPPAGSKVRIPNIFMANCTTAARTANVLPNATLATRFEFATGAGGVLSFDKCSSSWYMNFNQPYSITMSNTAICTTLVFGEAGSACTFDNVVVGQEAANAQSGLNMTASPEGGSFNNCVFTRATSAAVSSTVMIVSDVLDYTFTDCVARTFVRQAHTTALAMNAQRNQRCTFTRYTVLASGTTSLTSCSDVTFTDTVYVDTLVGNTLAANPYAAFTLSLNTDTLIDGFSSGGLTRVSPSSALVTVTTSANVNTKIRNIGTYAAPYDCGGPRVDGAAWTRSATTATVTSVAHGLTTGDVIRPLISSDVAAITVAPKTVTSTPTADTFTFTCLNAGAASGTLSYYQTITAYLMQMMNNAVTNGVKMQRIYTKGVRTSVYLGDNSNKGAVYENVHADHNLSAVIIAANSPMKGVKATPSLVAQTSVYGTHFFDHFIQETTPNTFAQAWSRSTTTATVTSTDHGLVTGALIEVTTTSDAAAIVKSQKTITALTKDTFTFTCLNAGGASGTLTFTPLNGRVAIQMNEATGETLADGIYTLDAGNPLFTSAGSLYMPTIGDQITFETPYYILGHDSFPRSEAVMAGGTIANYDITYAIDTGSGYSAFKNLSYVRAGGGGSNGSTTVTMTSTTGVAAGDHIWGTNIAPGAKVVSITNGTDIVVDTANVGAVSGVLRFNQMPSEAANPASGFKMKLRIKTVKTNVLAISSLLFYTFSTPTTRAYQYTLDPVDATYQLTNLVSGTEVVLLDSTNTELQRTVVGGSGIFTYDYTWNEVDITGCYVLIWHEDYKPIKLTGITLDENDQSVFVTQEDDLIYDAAADDRYTINFGSELIIMDTGETEFDVPGAYSTWKDAILVGSNAQYQFAFETAGGESLGGANSIPKYAFLVNGWRCRPDEADHLLEVVNGVLLVSGGGDPFVDTLGAYTVRISFQQPVNAIAVSEGGSLTADDVAAAVWAYTDTGTSPNTMGKRLVSALSVAKFLGLK